MKHWIWTGLIASALASAGSPTHTDYGEAFTIDQVITADALLATPGDFDGKTVRVRGRVADVCQKAGCWMVLTHDTAEGSRTMRIRMKDHGFSVAKDCTGSFAVVEGQVVGKEVDAAETAHFASESNKPEMMPENDAKRVYEIVATAVRIEDKG